MLCNVKGQRILTSAHSIANQTSILIRKYGQARRYNARVSFFSTNTWKVLEVGHECDLALLTVMEEEFWKDAEQIQMGGIPVPLFLLFLTR